MNSSHRLEEPPSSAKTFPVLCELLESIHCSMRRFCVVFLFAWGLPNSRMDTEASFRNQLGGFLFACRCTPETTWELTTSQSSILCCEVASMSLSAKPSPHNRILTRKWLQSGEHLETECTVKQRTFLDLQRVPYPSVKMRSLQLFLETIL